MTSDIIGREQASIFQTYRRLPLVVEHAEGSKVYAQDGSVYLDFLGGIAVNALGHSHPRIVDAIVQQAHRYMHISNIFYQEPQVRLAEQLKQITGFDRVFFTNSGTEATEGALKIGRRHGSARGATGLVGFSGGFHGRTYGALSVMDKPLYKDGMGPFLPDAAILPFNDVQALRDGVHADTCAVIVEFIQGEGGIVPATAEFVAELEALRRKHGFLLIADEIQTGIGRTGTFFAYEAYDIKPDVVTIAKSIGGGLPLGAILATESAAAMLEKGMHGTTYGGNALACVAGSIVLDELQHGLQEHVRHIGAYLHTTLKTIATEFPERVIDVRGAGCMHGLVLHGEAAPYVLALLEQHVIANATAGNVLRFVPPYVISEADVDTLGAALRTVLENVVPAS